MTTKKTIEQTTESMTGRDIVDLVSQIGPADLARPTPCAPGVPVSAQAGLLD